MPDWLRLVLIGLAVWTGVSFLSGAVYAVCAYRLREARERR